MPARKCTTGNKFMHTLLQQQHNIRAYEQDATGIRTKVPNNANTDAATPATTNQHADA